MAEKSVFYITTARTCLLAINVSKQCYPKYKKKTLVTSTDNLRYKGIDADEGNNLL
jgi:hypothetical protein